MLSIYLNDALRGGPKTHLTLTREGTLVSNLRILLAIIFGLAGFQVSFCSDVRFWHKADIPKLEAGISLMSEHRGPHTQGLFQNVDAS